MFDKIRGLIEGVEKLGNQLGTVQKNHDGLVNKLSSGQGNLLRQASALDELGVKVKKKLPKSLLEQADAEDESNCDSAGIPFYSVCSNIPIFFDDRWIVSKSGLLSALKSTIKT